MINNNKGTILVITIVSMMILTIIGYITLQMVSSQNVVDTYDQTKVRVDYAAEGIVERAKGYINFVVDKNKVPISSATVQAGYTIYGDVGDNPTGSGYLYSRVASATDGKWELLNDGSLDLVDYGGPVSEVIDSDMYPYIHASVYCEFLNPPPPEENGVTAIHTGTEQTYKIVGTAWADVSAADGSRIETTVICYFKTVQADLETSDAYKIDYVYNREILGWRKQS